jgi:hypothetical protein
MSSGVVVMAKDRATAQRRVFAVVVPLVVALGGCASSNQPRPATPGCVGLSCVDISRPANSHPRPSSRTSIMCDATARRDGRGGIWVEVRFQGPGVVDVWLTDGLGAHHLQQQVTKRDDGARFDFPGVDPKSSISVSAHNNRALGDCPVVRDELPPATPG